MANNKKFGYVEPADYFPKEIRKKNKIGEYAETKKSSGSKKSVKRK